MTDQDIVQMTARCIDEIKSLRARNDALTPQAEAYQLIRQILGLVPTSRLYGASEDIVPLLEAERAKARDRIATGG